MGKMKLIGRIWGYFFVFFLIATSFFGDIALFLVIGGFIYAVWMTNKVMKG